MHRVVNFKLADHYKIHVWFEDGSNAEVDFEAFLQKGFARELLNEENFKQVYIESGGGLSWKNGFDFCPNFLYQMLTKQIPENA